MKITLHANELKPTTLAAIVADMTHEIGYSDHYAANVAALQEALAALDGNCGETDADRLLELNDADFEVIDAYRRLATAS